MILNFYTNFARRKRLNGAVIEPDFEKTILVQIQNFRFSLHIPGIYFHTLSDHDGALFIFRKKVLCGIRS